MDSEAYYKALYDEHKHKESLCKRCGACCGAPEGDPCEELRRGEDGKYFCAVYEERFGLRKTVKGEPILCVPIRNMLHKSWWGKSQCAYVKAMRGA